MPAFNRPLIISLIFVTVNVDSTRARGKLFLESAGKDDKIDASGTRVKLNKGQWRAQSASGRSEAAS